jgi:5-methylcytosine-specific restriction endonuclease McrA
MTENSQSAVKWKCHNCGYTWKGKSPYQRRNRPTCRTCRSRNVHVYDWLIDKSRWKELRREVIKRDDFKCKRCGTKIELNTARIHHKTYYEYYNSDYLITLCIFCHDYTHKFFLTKFILWLKNEDLPRAVLTTEIAQRRLLSKILLIFLLLVLIIGITLTIS